MFILFLILFRTFIIENKENVNDAVEPEKSLNNFNAESARTSLQV